MASRYGSLSPSSHPPEFQKCASSPVSGIVCLEIIQFFVSCSIYHTILYYTILYYTMLYYTILCFTYIVLYSIVLHYVV